VEVEEIVSVEAVSEAVAVIAADYSDSLLVVPIESYRVDQTRVNAHAILIGNAK
jgi:hypothetical protein